ncbi:hypothetical protein M0R45_003522 [Rubus argutus]|uniref:GIY-YIG domain-containing protein n=1 Tax=Rubus argutus TaxID=59490 RepID=A0AAW1YI81_RUBAR
MVASDLTVAVERLKREECKRTKHDAHFSNWKILVGPSDWEDYSLGKEGAERYRLHNLPKSESPGLYELGIAVLRGGLGRQIEPDQIVPVYLGQADSVRTRLQQYGRTGAHLGSIGHPSDRSRKGPGFFEEVLARGYPVVYRWAPMGTKSEALKTESQLLNTFDYAWNTSINGVRRPDDVLQKLKKISSKSTRFANIVQRLLPSSHKQVGIRINSSKLVPTEEKFSDYADRESQNLPAQVFKLGRSHSRLVLDRSGITQENTIICGVAAADGSICRRPPVQGRKRCAEHKGMRIKGSMTVRILKTNVESKCSVISKIELDCHDASNVKYEPVELPPVQVHFSESSSSICGFILADGSSCRTEPIQGRKRCDEHKGRRIQKSSHKSVKEENVKICA